MPPKAPRHSMGYYFGLYDTITRLSKNSTIRHPTERKRFWLLTQRLNVLAAFTTQHFSQNTIKRWHLSRLKSYNSIHILLWSWKLKLHLLEIDFKISIFKVTTEQFFFYSEVLYHRKFHSGCFWKDFVALCLWSQALEPGYMCLNPSSVTFPSCVTKAKVYSKPVFPNL